MGNKKRREKIACKMDGSVIYYIKYYDENLNAWCVKKV